jgi:Zn-finger nucleic acid-binding protein
VADKPVNIDRCQKCYGAWLDDQELNSIVEEKKVDKIKPKGPLVALLRSVGTALKGK